MENDQNNGSNAASYLPAGRTLPTLKNAASECRGCELYAGPAGDVLNRALKEAGLDRRSVRGIDAKFRETLYESLVHDLKVAADLL